MISLGSLNKYANSDLLDHGVNKTSRHILTSLDLFSNRQTADFWSLGSQILISVYRRKCLKISVDVEIVKKLDNLHTKKYQHRKNTKWPAVPYSQ